MEKSFLSRQSILTGHHISIIFYLIFIYILCLIMQEKKTTILYKNTLTIGSHIFPKNQNRIWTFYQKILEINSTKTKNASSYKSFSKLHHFIKKIIKKYKKRVMEHVPRPECINIDKLTQARSSQGFPFVCQELGQ